MKPIRCTNADPGNFNHECGKAAQWAGARDTGSVQHFCSTCREYGWERHGVVRWSKIKPEAVEA
jgi:hypothetical protein